MKLTNPVGDFFDADVLTGEDVAQVDLAASEADATAASDGDGAVVERIDELLEAVIRPR